jgi:hypothetical protein
MTSTTGAKRPTYRQTSREARLLTLSQVLHAAAQTEEGRVYAGHSCRLLRIASVLCAQLAPGADDRAADVVVHEAFDIAALVAASRRVPGDQDQTEERVEMVAVAGRILDDLTDCPDSLHDGLPRLAARGSAAA